MRAAALAVSGRPRVCMPLDAAAGTRRDEPHGRLLRFFGDPSDDLGGAMTAEYGRHVGDCA